jgi:hypothetical protein
MIWGSQGQVTIITLQMKTVPLNNLIINQPIAVKLYRMNIVFQ